MVGRVLARPGRDQSEAEEELMSYEPPGEIDIHTATQLAFGFFRTFRWFVACDCWHSDIPPATPCIEVHVADVAAAAAAGWTSWRGYRLEYRKVFSRNYRRVAA